MRCACFACVKDRFHGYSIPQPYSTILTIVAGIAGSDEGISGQMHRPYIQASRRRVSHNLNDLLLDSMLAL